MPRHYTVELDVFRGAGIHPVAHREIQVIAPGALDAACRAEELVNVTVRDNEYAAAVRVIPHSEPVAVQALAIAA